MHVNGSWSISETLFLETQTHGFDTLHYPFGLTHLLTRCLTVISYHHRANWVKVEGITYKCPCSVVLGVEDYPVFGHLKGIFILNQEIYLHIQVAETITFNEHYHAYIVKATDTFKIVSVNTLFDPWPLHCRQLNIAGHYQQIIVIKHHILGTI